MIADGALIVLRPSRAAYGRALRANLWVAIPLLLISLARIGLNWWLLPFFVVAILVSVGGVLLYFRNARVEYGDGSYRVISMFGRRRTIQSSEAASVVTVTALRGNGVPGGTPQLIVVRADGSKILRLRGQTWDVEQFSELATDLMSRGVPNDAIREPISPVQLQARYPKVVSWAEAHPIALGLLLGVVILVVIVMVTVAIVAFTSS